MGERNVSSSIVGSIVQAANRKLRKSSNRKTILSSGGTSDNLSIDSSTVSILHCDHLKLIANLTY